MSENVNKVEIDISLNAIFKVIGVLVALGVAYLIREVFAVFFVSLVLSALIDPFADWCQRRKVSRSVAVLATYIGLLGIIAAIIVGIVPPMTREFGQLVSNSGDFVRVTFEKYAFLKSGVERLGGVDAIVSGLGALQGGESGSGIFGTLTGVAGGFAAIALVFALAYYMVVEEASMRKFFLSVTPNQYHEYWSVVLPRVQSKLGAWMRGQLTLSVIIACLVFVGLQLLGIKYALVLAMLSGFAEFVPYIGPIVGAVPAVFLAFAQSPVLGLITLTMYFVIQWTDNHILIPKVMQKATGINPIVSIVALLIGAKLGGLLGIVLAIPMAAACLVFTQDFFAREEAKLHHQHEHKD